MDNSTQNGATNSSNATGARGAGRPVPLRRSSVVVIPPMQVCPGDLLVYSKALTHGGNFTGISTQHTVQQYINNIYMYIYIYI